MICYDSDLGSLFNSSKRSEETTFLEGELFLSSSTLSSSKHHFFPLLNNLHLSLSCAFLSFLSSLSYLVLFEPSLQGSVHVFLRLTHLYLDSLYLVMWVVLFLVLCFFVFGVNICCHAALTIREISLIAALFEYFFL